MKFIYQLFISLYPLIARFISSKNEKAKLWVDGRMGIFDKLKHALLLTEIKSFGCIVLL